MVFQSNQLNLKNQKAENASSSVFTPVDSSNTFYIDSIPPKGKVEKEKNKDTDDAILFNGLVSSWGDLNEQARQIVEHPEAHQETLPIGKEK